MGRRAARGRTPRAPTTAACIGGSGRAAQGSFGVRHWLHISRVFQVRPPAVQSPALIALNWHGGPIAIPSGAEREPCPRRAAEEKFGPCRSPESLSALLHTPLAPSGDPKVFRRAPEVCRRVGLTRPGTTCLGTLREPTASLSRAPHIAERFNMSRVPAAARRLALVLLLLAAAAAADSSGGGRQCTHSPHSDGPFVFIHT